MHRDHKCHQAILITIAREDPNAFLAKASSAVDREELPDIGYLIAVARRAPGYDPAQDPFRSLPRR